MQSTALVVQLTLAKDCRDEFLAIVDQHAERSVRLEEGCLSFQVIVPEDSPDRVILVEVYRDKAALQAHWDSVHMADYRRRTGDMVRDRERVLGQLEVAYG